MSAASTEAALNVIARKVAYAKVSELITEMNEHEFESLPESVKHHLLNIRDAMREAAK